MPDDTQKREDNKRIVTEFYKTALFEGGRQSYSPLWRRNLNDEAQRCIQSGGRVHICHLDGRKDVSNIIGNELSTLALE
jgi:hypothetical protein